MLKTRARHPILETSVSERGEGISLVHCVGEVDIETASRFQTALDEGLRSATHRLVLDLERVTFMDSVGVGHIVKAYKRLKPNARLQVCTENAHIRMLLEIAGLNGLSSMHRSVEEALRSQPIGRARE